AGGGARVRIGHVQVAADGIDGNVREGIAAEIRSRAAVDRAGKILVAVVAGRVQSGHGHGGAKGLPLVGRFAHLNDIGRAAAGALVQPEHIDGMVGTHGYESALDVVSALGSDQGAAGGSKGIAVVGGAEEVDAGAAAEIAVHQVHVAVARAGVIVDGEPFL